MGDTLSGIGGLALIVGLIVAYMVERRALKRAKNVPQPIRTRYLLFDPVPEAIAPAPPSRSPNWGAPIIFCLLLFGAATQRGNFWGYVWQGLFLAIVGAGVYAMFSAKDFAIEQKRDPDLTKTRHYVTIGIPYVLFPMMGWTLVVPFGLKAGAIVPALAWVPLVLLAAGATLFDKLRSKST